MTEQTEPGVSSDRFAELYEASMGPVSAPEVAEEPVSSQETEEPLESPAEPSQDSPVDNPEPVAPKMSVVEARMWGKRIGLPDELFKSKSEEEILAIGLEASTAKRQDDRDFLARQTQESDNGNAAAAPSETPDPVGAGSGDEAGNPEAVDEARELAVLEAELGEDAARLVMESRREAREARAAAARLEARLDGDVQARQAAAAREQADRVLDGMGSEWPDLSKPGESRDKVLEQAIKQSNADQSRYMALPESDRLPTLLRDAALIALGVPKDVTPISRKTSPSPQAHANAGPQSERNRQEVGTATFAKLYRKHMTPGG